LKIAKKLAESFGIVILIIAIALVGFMLIGPYFGWETHPIISGSMEPALSVGGMIITKPVKLEDIKIGDIITHTGEQKVTHRVVDIIEEENRPWFQTKGDANEEPDHKLISSQGNEMRKVVFHLSYLGFAAQFMKSKLAFLVSIGIPAIILIVWFSKDIKKAILEEKAKRKGQS